MKYGVFNNQINKTDRMQNYYYYMKDMNKVTYLIFKNDLCLSVNEKKLQLRSLILPKKKQKTIHFYCSTQITHHKDNMTEADRCLGPYF